MTKETTVPEAHFHISSYFDLSRTTLNRVSKHNQNGHVSTVHERAVAQLESSVDVRDHVSFPGDMSGRIVVEWEISRAYIVVSHGHGFELFLGSTKVADLFVTAGTALRVEVIRGTARDAVHSDSPFGYQSLQISTIANETEITCEWNFRDFKYTNRNLVGGSEAWARFESKVGLNYLLKTSNDPVGSKFLLIGFSAIRPIGDFTYNYKASLEDIDANVLFILDDFGDQGAYYYADHDDSGIFSSVQELMAEISAELSVPKENMILFGSSKGGAAALLHGFSYGAGHVYVGAPQTKIGTFVSKPHPNVLELIMGDTSQKAIDQLDSVIFRAVETAQTFPKTTLIVGNADHHLEKHAIPLRDFAKAHGHHINLHVLRGVPHGEIGYKYRGSLHGYVTRVLANYAREAGF